MGKKDKKVGHEHEKGQVKELEEFKIHMLTNQRSKKTIKNYTENVGLMLEWIKKAPRRVKSQDLERYKTHMSIEKNYSKNSMYIHIKSIQAFYIFLGMDVATAMNPPKRPASLPKYLSEEEMKRLFEAALTDEVNGIRDYAILTIFGFTGLRVSELCNLNTEDIDFSETTIKVRSGKGDKDRLVIFEETTERALREHLGSDNRHIAKKESSAVFASAKKRRMGVRSVEKMVKRCAAKAGIEKQVTPPCSKTYVRHNNA